MQYRLIVEYDGTEFHGWQLQPDRRTVQGTLEDALLRLLGRPTRVAAAGRTDAGVHAAAQVVCFHSEREIVLRTLRRALNALTPGDLTVCAADIVGDDFDPRRGARSRRYVYRIWNRAEPSPFWRRYAWHIPQPLDRVAMQDAATMLVGEHDFSSFRATGCAAAHPVRRVLHSAVERRGALLLYEIEATAFLRHMVRNIVGTLVEVGRAKRSPDFAALLAARDRTLAAATAPAHGLCLVEIRYGGESASG
jgi:tRNA pseudouridine38-40 synthase